jgi:hypothetical protein
MPRSVIPKKVNNSRQYHTARLGSEGHLLRKPRATKNPLTRQKPWLILLFSNKIADLRHHSTAALQFAVTLHWHLIGVAEWLFSLRNTYHLARLTYAVVRDFRLCN